MNHDVVPLQKGLYLYALVDNLHAPQLQQNLGQIGINQAEVFLVPTVSENKDICAVVSACGLRKIRPERKNLEAHKNVLVRLLSQTTVLPISFGVISDSELKLRELLAENTSLLAEQMSGVLGCVEFGLKIQFARQNVFEWLVSEADSLSKMRDVLLEQGEQATRDFRIAAGRAVEAELNRIRNNVLHDLSESLGASLRKFVERPLKSELNVADLALLIERAEFPEFEKRLDSFAEKTLGFLKFDLTGPWALHHFVSLSLNPST